MMKYLLNIVFCSWLMLFWGACAGDTYRIGIEEIIVIDSIGNDSVYTSNLLFFGTVGSHADVFGSRSDETESLPNGCHVTVYVYQQDSTPQNANVYKQMSFVIQNSGYFTPVYNVARLDPGVYNLYAVSVYNSTTDQIPNFDLDRSGEATGLQVGMDYLWCSTQGVELTPGNVQILDIYFQHAASKITIDCVGGYGYTVSSVEEVVMYSLDTSATTFQLATGYISPVTDLASGEVDLTIDGTTASIDIPPFNTSNYYSLGCYAYINFEYATGGWLSFDLPTPDSGAFLAGYNYNYTVEFTPFSTRTGESSPKARLTSVSPL